MTRFAAKLKESGITQTELAKKIGVSQATISLYANGWRIPPEILAGMAEVLDCEPEELVGNVEEVAA